MPVDGALREAGSEGHLVQRHDLEAPLGEQLEPGGDEERAGFGFAALVNDSHGYLGY